MHLVVSQSEEISGVNDTYWHMRAEVVPEEERTIAEGEQLVHCYHIPPERDAATHAGNTGGGASPAPAPFGDPFLLKASVHSVSSTCRDMFFLYKHALEAPLRHFRYPD